MRDGARGHEAQLVAGGDRRVLGAGLHLEAPHVGAGHAGHARVGLVVLGLPHRLPVRGVGLAVDDQSREVVCVVGRRRPLVSNGGLRNGGFWVSSLYLSLLLYVPGRMIRGR